IEGRSRDLSSHEPALGSISGTVTEKTVRYQPELYNQLFGDIREGDSFTKEEQDAMNSDFWQGFVITTEEPMPGLDMIIREHSFQRASTFKRHVVTDKAGCFSFDALPQGQYEIQIVRPDDIPRLRQDDRLLSRKVYLKAGEANILDFSLPAENAAITGRIINREGRPVVGARVSANTLDNLGLSFDEECYGDRRRLETIHVSTDNEGRYALTGLLLASFTHAMEYICYGECPRDMYVVTAEADGYGPVRVLAPPFTRHLEKSVRMLGEGTHALSQRLGSRNQTKAPYEETPQPSFAGDALAVPDIELYNSATLSGVVENTYGEIQPAAEVKMVLEESSKTKLSPLKPVPILPKEVKADDQGAFQISSLPPGLYTFEIRTEVNGLQKAINPALMINEGVSLEKVRVVVKADEKGILFGMVADRSTGDPVEAFTVEVSTPAGLAYGNFREGSFHLRGVPAEEAKVTIKASEYASEVVLIHVQGGTENELHAALSRAGSVEGQVTLDGSPVTGIMKVYLHGGSGPAIHSAWFDGRYRIDGLKGGVLHRLVVHAQPTRGSNANLIAHISIVPQTNAVTSQDFALHRPPSEIQGEVVINGPLDIWQVKVFEGSMPDFDTSVWNPNLRAGTHGRASPADFHILVWPGTYTVLARQLVKDDGGELILVEEKTELVTVDNGEKAKVSFLFK
ncbi:MAG: hypothetical protein ABIK28_15790, partial [Planctomycetota bacterium]